MKPQKKNVPIEAKKPIRKEAFNPSIKERDMKLDARDMGCHGIEHFLNEDEK